MKTVTVRVPDEAYHRKPRLLHADVVEEALDQYVNGFLQALVSALDDTYVPLLLELTGMPATAVQE